MLLELNVLVFQVLDVYLYGHNRDTYSLRASTLKPTVVSIFDIQVIDRVNHSQ